MPEMDVELEYQTITGADTIHLFFKVVSDDFATFEETVAGDPTVAEETLILEADEFRVYRMRLVATEHLVLPKAAELGARILHARGGGGGWIAKLQVPDTTVLQEFRDICERKDVRVTTRRIYRTDGHDGGGEFGLTPAQRETLRTAHEAGYFEEPRDVSLEEIADRLEVSSSAASGRLRRALDALVDSTVLEE